MSTEIAFENIPAGYSETASKKGETVRISSYGFFSSEDGDELIRRLEGLPQQIISLIPTKQPILPSMIDSLVAIIRKDKSATVYLNEITTIAKIRTKRNVEKKGNVFLQTMCSISDPFPFKD